MPTPVLCAAAIAAIVVDLAVAGSAAVADDGAPQVSLAPSALPIQELSQPVPTAATVTGLDVRSEIADDGTYEVVITNPTGEPIAARLGLALNHTRGNPVGRMGPRTWSIHSDELQADVEAGDTLRHRLEGVRSAPLEAEEVDAGVMVMGGWFPVQVAVNLLHVWSIDDPMQVAFLDAGGTTRPIVATNLVDGNAVLQ